MDRLSAAGLDVALGGRVVLMGASLSVAPSEVLGLIGPNGAGKTTLLRALAGLVPPARGRVLMGRADLASIPPRERARRIGYLAQGGGVAWPLSVGRLVALGRLPHLGPWQQPGAADAEAIARALAGCDVVSLVDRAVLDLSGGERARVLLARVLAGDPGIILADEPVAGLDPAHQLRVMMLLRARAAEGAGVAIVLHDLALAARFCDRLALLHEGRVVALGPAATVLQTDRLADVYGVAMRAVVVDGQRVMLPWEAVTAPAAIPR